MALRVRAQRKQKETELTQGQSWGALSPDVLALTLVALDLMLVPLADIAPLARYAVVPLIAFLAIWIFLIVRGYVGLIQVYPEGAGAYSLTKEQFGRKASLPVAALLMFNTVLVAALTVSLAVSLVTYVFPEFIEYRNTLCLAALVVITLLHLRGTETIRPTAVFAYLFLGALAVIVLLSISRFFDKALIPSVPAPGPVLSAAASTDSRLWICAFLLGSVVLSAFEALSNSVGIFRQGLTESGPKSFRWLAWTSVGSLFILLLLLLTSGADFSRDRHFLISLGETAFGGSFGWIIWMPVTVLMLLTSADRSYARFPVVASVIAQDRYLPRQLASLGDRLVFANSMVAISAFVVVLVIGFDVNPIRLGQVLAVSTLASLALTQAAMARTSLESRWDPAKAVQFLPAWLHGILSSLCAIGSVLALIFFWDQGAWAVLIVVPMTVWYFSRVKEHYVRVGRELSLPRNQTPPKLQRLRHTVIVPVSGLHRGVVDALRYGVSISDDVRACYVELDPEASTRLQEQWNRWAREVPFVILKSKNRSVVSPILEYIQDLKQTTSNELITVIIPEFVTTRWWHRLLHNQTAFLIRTSLLFKPGIVVTSVRYHLRAS